MVVMADMQDDLQSFVSHKPLPEIRVTLGDQGETHSSAKQAKHINSQSPHNCHVANMI